MKFDIVGIGEALIEFAEVEPNHYVQSYAGDIVNSLYYASRLGLRASFFSVIGQDTFSTDLLKFFDHHGVNRSAIKTSTKQNGLYIIRTDSRGEPSYTFFRDDSAARTMFDVLSDDEFEKAVHDASVLMFSAIGLAAFLNRQRFVDLISKRPADQHIFFDTNVRRQQWGNIDTLRSCIEMLAPHIDILSTSQTDDDAIFGPRSVDEALDYYRRLGIRRVIFRQADKPVEFLFDEVRGSVRVPTVDPVVDATGAGDAFNAAFIAGYLQGYGIETAVKMGVQAATQVIRYRGGIVPQFDPALVTSNV
jgi:2-dehydro-3-deoxygluconokinase